MRRAFSPVKRHSAMADLIRAGYLLPSPACARVIGGHHRSGRAIRGSNYSRSATRERQGQHQHQKLPHGHLPWFDANVSRIGAGEGDWNHKIVDCRAVFACATGPRERRT
jgi:hypothetical protein